MKKALIAGTASAALATLPMVCAMAADPAAITDTIQVTVGETCTFESSYNGDHTYNLSMSVNDVKATTTGTTFTAICNNANGFTVSAVPTSIAGAGEAITYSTSTPTAGSGTWTATVDDSETIAATNGILMSENTPTSASGVSKTVKYTVSTHSNQAQGSYSGTMKYTLTQAN